MKQILLVIYPTFSEFEITVTTTLLKSKYKIVTVAPKQEQITGESGLQFIPHLTFNEVRIEDYEAIIIPGGDLLYIKDEQILFDLVKDFNRAGKLIGAICSGPYVLGKAGILNDLTYTVTLSQEQRDFLGCFHLGQYLYQPVVEANNIITAQGHAYVDFALCIGKKLASVTEYHVQFYKGIENAMMN